MAKVATSAIGSMARKRPPGGLVAAYFLNTTACFCTSHITYLFTRPHIAQNNDYYNSEPRSEEQLLGSQL